MRHSNNGAVLCGVSASMANQFLLLLPPCPIENYTKTSVTVFLGCWASLMLGPHLLSFSVRSDSLLVPTRHDMAHTLMLAQMEMTGERLGTRREGIVYHHGSGAPCWCKRLMDRFGGPTRWRTSRVMRSCSPLTW